MDRDAVRKVFLPRREDCLAYLRSKRWKDGIKCPYCGSPRVWKDGTTPKGAQKYECEACGAYFNDLTCTILENHKLPIEEMFYILKEMEAKSTLQISEELGRDYNSILNFVHHVQRLASSYANTIKLEDIVELDEAYVHSGEKKDKPRRRASSKRGTWDQDKPPVLTMLKRGEEGKVPGDEGLKEC